MKSAERYRYEANCNGERRELFKAMAVAEFLTSIFVVNDKVSLSLLLATFGSIFGMNLSSAIQSNKAKRSLARSSGVEAVWVNEKHFITRRQLYRN